MRPWNDPQRPDWPLEAERMVQEQILARGVRNPRVLAAMRAIPRHLFVPPQEQRWAYVDNPLPIGYGQTISQPYIVARMLELLDPQPEDKVLEVGTGSGYQAALLGLLANEVHTVERIPQLAEEAAARLARLGLDNVHVHITDGTLGWPQAAPYDGIVVAAAAPKVPQALLAQLADGGRLVIPVGHRYGQTLERWVRHGNTFHRERFEPVAFVPLIGQEGWDESSLAASP
ncbi:MAG: protein-L-isoaspartate(D-aspartate) O-methyltransferase [Chloroflexi bacterium]|nr:protein-L-isoaspartate(D-aspartate) O-methyltransferase [Chloroflexota bacterium]